MKRVAFTIIYNGEHHLTHNNYAETMVHNFDMWVIVEGAALPTGSTSWCKDVFNSSGSQDKTIQFIEELCKKHSNVVYVPRIADKAWPNKDVQVNAGIKILKNYLKNSNLSKCFLWQVDIDEQWSKELLEQAESELIENNGKTGCFLCNYFVGSNLVAVGDWGEGKSGPYRRLWMWEGEEFSTHEPPKLNGKNGPGLLLRPRFNHYAYCFEQDVIFKEKYYGYNNLIQNWRKLQQIKIANSIHISALLDRNTNHWANTNTFIIPFK